MDAAHMGADLEKVLITEEEIHAKLDELAAISVGVVKGEPCLDLPYVEDSTAQTDMNVVMTGKGLFVEVQSSGVVRILKDLDTDITGRHVLIVEDIIDSGLTLSWIKANLESRNPASVEICTLLRKPEAAKVDVDVKWVGFDIPNEFVVGYGLDFADAYRGLRCVGTLAPHVYS